MMSRTSASCACLLLLSLSPGCAEDEAPRAPSACVPEPAGAPLTDEQVYGAGVHAVGELSLTLVDESRTTPAHGGVDELPSRTLLTRVYYPATDAGNGAPLAAGGPFPLVVYSHGFSSFNTEASQLGKHLASHGYVVFAPGFPLSQLATPGGPTGIDIASQPGDVSFLIDVALDFSGTSGHVLEGGVDPARIAAAGLSFGGLTSLLVTFHPTLHDPRVKLVVALAPPTGLFTERFYDTREDLPMLLLSGDIDAIVPHDSNAVVAFARANPPTILYTLRAGTHTGFTSISRLFENQNNADETGCAALAGGGGGGEEPAPEFDLAALLGGEDAGIEPVWLDEDLCQGALPRGMRPTRQLAITDAAVLSFLDAYFAPDPLVRGRSCHYNERVLRRASDLRFQRK